MPTLESEPSSPPSHGCLQVVAILLALCFMFMRKEAKAPPDSGVL